ncbi:regulator of microtubule dynamics protein 1-like [Hylaeus volcanicus]|uniref:regulator of microtubule dynamics protein 1-like n=1 Tax=Hylaeus volcanicus TaxID=313075 RepID=UPI0023B83BBA|nr:regulator of microtubule dynamics protein 1-like [Hylaeus volcanicus]
MFVQKVLRFTRNTKILQRSFAHRGFQFSQKKNNHHTFATKICITSSLTAMSMWGLTKKKGDPEKGVTTKEVLITKADALFDQGHYKEMYLILTNYRDSGDVEIIWRLCRALYKMAKSATEVEGKKMIYEAYDLIANALKIKEDHWAVHKWMAIILDSKSNYEGMKIRIKELYNIKKHMMRAIELNPKDATTMYMLGTWCYQVSDLPWYQRKIAAAIFEKPPNSSFEEALTYFENAEKVDPYFYSHNLLMLGKTYLKLNQKEQALKYLKMTAEYPVKNDDDHNAQQEAQKLLNSLQK